MKQIRDFNPSRWLFYAAQATLLTLFLLGHNNDVNAEEEVCYKPYGEPVTSTHHVTTLLISVHWIDPDDYDAEGASECLIEEHLNTGWCEVWIPKPVRVLGDPYMDAIGHEIMHGLEGDFHDE